MKTRSQMKKEREVPDASTGGQKHKGPLKKRHVAVTKETKRRKPPIDSHGGEKIEKAKSAVSQEEREQPSELRRNVHSNREESSGQHRVLSDRNSLEHVAGIALAVGASASFSNSPSTEQAQLVFDEAAPRTFGAAEKPGSCVSPCRTGVTHAPLSAYSEYTPVGRFDDLGLDSPPPSSSRHAPIAPELATVPSVPLLPGVFGAEAQLSSPHFSPYGLHQVGATLDTHTHPMERHSLVYFPSPERQAATHSLDSKVRLSVYDATLDTHTHPTESHSFAYFPSPERHSSTHLHGSKVRRPVYGATIDTRTRATEAHSSFCFPSPERHCSTHFLDSKVRPSTEEQSKEEDPKTEKGKLFKRWTKEEDEKLKTLMERNKGRSIKWSVIAYFFDGERTAQQCKSRWKNAVSPHINRKPFSVKEDLEIIHHRKLDVGWPEIAGKLDRRTPEQIRDRFVNFIDPELKTTPWTDEEDAILKEAQNRLGNKWMDISMLLVGRSEKAIKNRWYNRKTKALRKERRRRLVEERSATLESFPSPTALPPTVPCDGSEHISWAIKPDGDEAEEVGQVNESDSSFFEIDSAEV